MSWSSRWLRSVCCWNGLDFGATATANSARVPVTMTFVAPSLPCLSEGASRAEVMGRRRPVGVDRRLEAVNATFRVAGTPSADFSADSEVVPMRSWI